MNYEEIETQTVEKHTVNESNNLLAEEVNIADIKKESLQVQKDINIARIKSETLHVEKNVNIKNEKSEVAGNENILLIKHETSHIEHPNIIEIEKEKIICEDGDENQKFLMEKKIVNADVENKNVLLDENTGNIFKSIVGSQNNRISEFDMNSDSDSSSILSRDSSSDSDSDSFFENLHKSVPKLNPVKTKEEVPIDELPPVDYINLTVPKNELETLGKISGIVDKLVIVQSLENLPALDEGSVIFLSPTEPLGRVYEVFGPVNKPFYSVRFNSHEDIIEKGITIDTFVMFTPQKEDLALYVLVENLKLQKGSDASWKNNDEPPEEFIDYSDDEKEKAAKQKKKAKNRKLPNDDDITVCFQKKKAPCFGSLKQSSHHFGFSLKNAPAPDFQCFPPVSTPAPHFQFRPPVPAAASGFRFPPPVSSPSLQQFPLPVSSPSLQQFSLPVSSPSPHRFPPPVSSPSPHRFPPPVSSPSPHQFPPPVASQAPFFQFHPPLPTSTHFGFSGLVSNATPGLPPASAATPHFGLIPPASSPAHFHLVDPSCRTSFENRIPPGQFESSSFTVPRNVISRANASSTVFSRMPPPHPHYL